MSQVVGAVVVQEGKLLLVRHHGQERWVLPSDRLLPGETPAKCLNRVLLQECGVLIEQGGARFERKFLGAGLPDWGEIELSAWLVGKYAGKIEQNLAHDEIAWVEPRHLPDYPCTEVDTQCVHYLLINDHLLAPMAEAAA